MWDCVDILEDTETELTCTAVLHNYSYYRQAWYNNYVRNLQVAHTQQTHNGPNAVSPRDKGASDNQSMPKAQNSTARGAHCRSDLHPSQRPKDLTQNAGSQPRWQASTERTRRWSEERPQRQHRQHSPNCRPHDQPASSLDLARGCVTERGHAGCDVSRCDASEGAVASLDTSRSELGVVTRGTCRVPNYRVTKKGEPDALDELLDYLWVYQGMGRQVLNLHMPREAWDRKLFNKPLKLPPIPKGNNSAALNPSDGGSSRRAENDGIRLERRTVSEPAYVIRSHEPAGSLASGSDLQSQQSETRYAGSESADHEAGGAALGARTRSHVVGGRREKMKLVVKMPVLTQEVSCADLLEKE